MGTKRGRRRRQREVPHAKTEHRAARTAQNSKHARVCLSRARSQYHAVGLLGDTRDTHQTKKKTTGRAKGMQGATCELGSSTCRALSRCCMCLHTQTHTHTRTDDSLGRDANALWGFKQGRGRAGKCGRGGSTPDAPCIPAHSHPKSNSHSHTDTHTHTYTRTQAGTDTDAATIKRKSPNDHVEAQLRVRRKIVVNLKKEEKMKKKPVEHSRS